MLQTLGTIAEFLCALLLILLLLVTLVTLVAGLIGEGGGGVWEAMPEVEITVCVEEDVRAGRGVGACAGVRTEARAETFDEAEVETGGVYGTVTGIREDLWNGR